MIAHRFCDFSQVIPTCTSFSISFIASDASTHIQPDCVRTKGVHVTGSLACGTLVDICCAKKKDFRKNKHVSFNIENYPKVTMVAIARKKERKKKRFFESRSRKSTNFPSAERYRFNAHFGFMLESFNQYSVYVSVQLPLLYKKHG